MAASTYRGPTIPDRGETRDEFLARTGRGHVSVFWDFDDFPVPEGRGIREIIVSALSKIGYTGDVSIMAYGESETNPFPSEQDLTFVPKTNKLRRPIQMMVDVCFWAADSFGSREVPPAILMVVARKMIENTAFLNVLGNVQSWYGVGQTY